MQPFLRLHSVFVLLGLAASACSSAPETKVDENAPAWTKQPARTVDNGYIIYVGTGEDRAPEKSRFKAEGMALQDLANECSFAPKGARIEDHYDSQAGVIYRSFAKVAIEFQDCDAAKAANTPDQIRTIANAQLTDEVKRYRDVVDEPEEDEDEELAANPMPNSPPPAVHNSTDYFVVRQQVAFVKEDVILAPAYYYPPAAPQTMAPVPQLGPAAVAVKRYETENPGIRTSPAAFSNSRPNFQAHQPSALRESAAERSRITNTYKSGGRGNGRGGRGAGQHKSKSRRRKRD